MSGGEGVNSLSHAESAQQTLPSIVAVACAGRAINYRRVAHAPISTVSSFFSLVRITVRESPAL